MRADDRRTEDDDIEADRWNDTVSPYERDQTIDDVFLARAKETPDALAIETSERQVTYRELEAMSARIARVLAPVLEGPTEPGTDRYVGVMADRSVEAVAAFLGVLRAGAGYVPLDPNLPDERLRYIVDDTDARAVLAPAQLVSRCPFPADDVITIEEAMASEAGDDDRDARPMVQGSDITNAAYVMYTSGSTGRPKGVVVEHRGVLRYVRGAEGLLPGPGDKVLLVNQLGFDASTYEIWAALTNGSTLVIHGAGRVDPSEAGVTIERHGVTVAFFATGLFHQMVEAALSNLSSLRLVLVGGDVLSPVLSRRFVETFPSSRLINAYGPTETTVTASVHEVRPGDGPGGVPIGKPLHNTTLYVLDERGNRVAEGEPGELYIGGDGVARGYLNQPERTSEAFVTDPFGSVAGGRLYRSGDLVRLAPNGELEFLGRLDDQVKIRGYRIEPAEVETVLRTHPALDEVVVVAREDVPGHKRLVAYVTSSGGTTSAQVRRFALRRLPEYMVPSAFVLLDRIPLSATGKIDRAALPAPVRSSMAGKAAALSPSEEVVAAAWEDVLRVSDASPDDDFFEAGGDSLLALALLARLGDATGRSLPIEAVFEERTLGALARRLETAPAEAGTLPPLRRVPHDEPVAASVSQAQVLFMSELAEASLPYQSQAVLWLDGDLDVAALEKALARLVDRHEILRTTFPYEDGDWVQRLHPPFDVRLPVLDLRAEADPGAAFERVVDHEFRQRIDPTRLPLIRWALARLADDRHALVQVEHHLVHDGASFARLLGEIAASYREGVNSAAARAPVRFSYRDFAAWQRALAKTEAGQAQLDYWVRTLENAPTPLELPADHLAPVTFTYRGAALREPVPPELFDDIQSLSASLGCTPYMVMTAAFFAFLHRYTGETDIVVGSGLANRRVPGTDSIVGMLVNTVPLRARLAADVTARRFIEQVRDVCLGAYAAQEIPFEEVVRRVAPERHGGPSPLYRHLFSFHDSPFPSLDLPGLRITPQDAMNNGSAKAELNIVVINRRGREGQAGAPRGPDDRGRAGEGDVTVVWEYCSDLFEEPSARRMVATYLHLLSQMVSEPTLPLSDLALTVPDEHAALLRRAVNQQPYERDASIGEVFAACVRRHADACAVSGAGGQLSYRQLDRRADLLARRLVAAGVRPGTCVGVIDDRSLEMVVALVGVLKAGAAYVGLDPSLPAARFDDLLGRAGIRIVCASEASARHPAVQRTEQSGVGVLRVEPEPAAERGADAVVLPEVGPEDLAYLSFTSGSTGEPKGVEVVHRGVVRLVRGTDYVDLGPDESLLGMAPLSFDASTFEIWGALLNGGRLVLAPAGLLSPGEIAEVVHSGQVTTMWLSAAVFHQMVDYELGSLAGVRQLVAGGDVLSPLHVNQVLAALPPGGALVNGYGPTETTTFACCHRMPAGSRVDGPVPIGRPIANTTVHILDEHRRPVPVGVPGELYIGGDGLARGYLGRPDLTAERFVPDPFSETGAARLYRSGDLGRWSNDGTIQFLGRRDRQVKIRGFRVEPAEVEAALLRHPSVKQAHVLAHTFGPDDKRLIAYVAGTGDATAEDLQAHLAGLLPGYLRPALYLWIDALPLTPGGKIDTSLLPDPPSTWTPADGLAYDGDPTSAGRNTLAKASGATRLEQRLITLWQEVLGVRPIGLDESFFDLGGHSLLAVALFAEVERTTGARLPLATIFEAPTIRAMAAVLREGGWDSAWDSLIALTTTGSRIPIFCVTAGDGNTIGFGALARRLGPDQPFYALQPRGLDGRVLLHRNVEGMAAHYVRQIRRVQPHGPYVLGGRCFGTLVAYEMTRILEGAGERVALLLALDSVGPLWRSRRMANGVEYDPVMNLCLLRARAAGVEHGDIFGDASAADRFVEYLGEAAREAGGSAVNRYLFGAYLARPDLQAAYPLDVGDFVGLHYWAWEGGISEMGMNPALLPALPDGIRRPKPSADPRHRPWYARASARSVDWLDYATRGRLRSLTVRRQTRLLEIATQTALYYRGGPSDVRVALIRSDEHRDDPQLARWYGLETGGVEEHRVSGSHQSMLREPDVASLAQCVEACVDAVSAGVTGAD